MADTARSTSGYIVTGVGSGKDWRTNQSGFIEQNPGGNANPSIPKYGEPESGNWVKKDNPVGMIVKR